MSSRCRAEPLTSAERQRVRALRSDFAQAYGRREQSSEEPIHPTLAYALLTGLRVDPYIDGRIRAFYHDAPLHPEDGPGYVYAFRDADDEPSLLKIGETSRTPERRIAEWRTALGDDGARLSLMFAYATLRRRLVELVVHALLAGDRDALRVNRTTNRLLREYFHVESLTRTKYLLDAVVQHVNWFARTYLGEV